MIATIALKGPAEASRHARARRRGGTDPRTPEMPSPERDCGAPPLIVSFALRIAPQAVWRRRPAPAPAWPRRRSWRRRAGRVARANHDVGVGPAFVLERIAADRHVGMRLGDLAERRADSPSRQFARWSPTASCAGLQGRRDLVEHRLHDRGTPAITIDIADAEAGRRRNLVHDQIGAGRNARHAQPRLVNFPLAANHVSNFSTGRADRRRSARRRPWRCNRR